ncbi:hypothetical protein BRX37_08290 [Sphingomonas sp. S-NIH.Pt3_0716]|nr:hypothetical protein BRX37_08290 [Sphingomonas sp. S-NIH.Pt3_0716]
MNAVSDLARRLSRARDKGRGIRLTDADLDLFFLHGGNDAIQQAAAAIQKEDARCRDAQRRREFISAVPIGSIGTASETAPFDPPTSPSSGMTPSEDGSEAFQRAQQMTRRRSAH